MAIIAAGLPPARPLAIRSAGADERVEIAKRLGRSGIRTADIAQILAVSPRTARGYLNASRCLTCGRWVSSGASRCRRCAARRARPPERTRHEVVTALRRWADQTGRPPRSEDWSPTTDPRSKWAREYPSWPRVMTVRTLFGSWNAGLRAAGLRPHRRYWRREEILERLKAWTEHHGQPPRQTDLRYGSTDMPTMRTIAKQFGSYRAALEAAGIEPHRRR